MLPPFGAVATVYASGKQRPLCAAAHAGVVWRRIVYVNCSGQITPWRAEPELAPGPVQALPIQEVVPAAVAEHAMADRAEHLRDLQRRLHSAA
ncbi:MAG: hypothetical protein ABIN44_04020 [Burkholderiaceae bacterium]